jgi:two-component system cell cycle sensor histidine kinase/response regulator CckA
MQKVALVVDDNGPVRTYIKAALQREGFRTLEAEDGEFGLEIVRRIGSDIHLVISDIEMPKLDGIQLAHLVRAEFPEIPIILISGYADAVLQDLPKVEFIPKPFLSSTLLSVVRKMVTMAKTATPDSMS